MTLHSGGMFPEHSERQFPHPLGPIELFHSLGWTQQPLGTSPLSMSHVPLRALVSPAMSCPNTP